MVKISSTRHRRPRRSILRLVSISSLISLVTLMWLPSAARAQDAGGVAGGGAAVGAGPGSGAIVGGAVAAGGPVPMAGPAPMGASSLAGAAAAAASSISPAQLGAAASALGISPEEAQDLMQKAANGTLSDDKLQTLAGRLGALHLSSDQISAIAHSLGISDDSVNKINQTLKSAKQNASQNSANQNPVQNALSAPLQLGNSQSTNATNGLSTIESRFRNLDLPSQIIESPTLGNLSQFGYQLFASNVSTFAPVENVPVDDGYIIGPGDQFVILEWGRVNQTVNLKVERDGSIQIDQIGPLQVGGLTFAQAKKLIEGAAAQITGTSVSVTMGQLRTIQVFVVGEVPNPGAYTVSALSRVTNALVAAGGITKIGSLRDVELRRDNRVITTLDLYAMLLRGDSSNDLRLAQGDTIFVPVIGRVVAVAGDVKRPAIYELSRRVEDLPRILATAGGVSAFGYGEWLQVERIQSRKKMIALDVNLQEVAARRFQIQDGDVIKIYAVLPDRDNIVTLSGNVHRPGDYQWYQGITVSNLLKRGEGPLPHTYYAYALIKRLQGAQKYTHYLPVDLGVALTDPSRDLVLAPRDELQIFSQDELRELPHVTITGEVRVPGDYPLGEHMRVSDLVYLAGGLKDNAYRAKAELARTQVVNGAQTAHIFRTIDLRKALSGSEGDTNPMLRTNDQLFVRSATDWHMPWTVKVGGRVARPGVYTISSGIRLSQLVSRCGGFLPDAFPQGMILRRASVKAAEQQRLDESRARLQQEVATLALAESQLGSSNSGNQNPSGMTRTFLGLQSLLATSETQQAQGRIVVHFTSLGSFDTSPEDLTLEDQDTIDVPVRPASVNVLGQVYNPTSIIARRELTVRDYINKAGGVTQQADRDHIIVVKADGSVLTDDGIKQSDTGIIFPLLPVISGGLMGTELQAGDTVYVPEDIEQYEKLQVTKDVTQIIANVATGLAVVGLLATRL